MSKKTKEELGIVEGGPGSVDATTPQWSDAEPILNRLTEDAKSLGRYEGHRTGPQYKSALDRYNRELATLRRLLGGAQ
jgi:hypothetical protein